VATQANISQRYGARLVPVALADTSGALFNAEGLDTPSIAALATSTKSTPIKQQSGALPDLTARELVKHAHSRAVTRAIVIDTTDAQDMESVLHQSLDLGYGIVLANKRPLAGAWSGVRRFYETSYARFEACVGAGLPVVTTLRYLVDTGDEVQHIEGALSRTLGYICTCLEDGQTFSTAVEAAQSKGFTEPLLNEDLSGLDVARKALILARLAGWPLELDDIRVDPLYPARMENLDINEFIARLPQLNSDFAAYMGALTGVPRYIAEIRPDGGIVGLRMVGKRLATALRGPVNQVALTTRRYADHPLTLAGPGEGSEVSAAAVLQDCIQLAMRMVEG
jgi:homoserine dehydrogenase